MDVRFLFENYCLDAERRELACGSELIAIGPKVFDLLLYLVQNRDQVVTRDDCCRPFGKAGLSRNPH